MKLLEWPGGDFNAALAGFNEVANSRPIPTGSGIPECNHNQTAFVSRSLPWTRMPQAISEAQNHPLLCLMQQASQEILSNPEAIVYGGIENEHNGRRPTCPYDINCGLCEEWGERVAELYREATGNDDIDVVDPGNLSGHPNDDLFGHVFIRFHGRYYDAECPEGVDDWRKLLLFTKQIARSRERVVSTDIQTIN